MPPVRTAVEILTDLNTNHGTGWVEVPGVNGLPIVNVTGPGLINFSPNAGMVVKTFINTNTAELRFYLAKLVIDLPGRENL